MAITGNRNVKNLPLDSDGKRAWSFGYLSCCEDWRACRYPESLRRYPLTELQAAVHAGVPVFYMVEIGGALIISIHMATQILVAMKASLQTVGSTLSLESLAVWVGSYRWGFLFHHLCNSDTVNSKFLNIQPNILTSIFLVDWPSKEYSWTVWHPRQQF